MCYYGFKQKNTATSVPACGRVFLFSAVVPASSGTNKQSS